LAKTRFETMKTRLIRCMRWSPLRTRTFESLPLKISQKSPKESKISYWTC
jgi:hypothetical protein